MKKTKTKKHTKESSKKKVGRPSVLNSDSVQKLVEIFRLDGTIEEACSQAGISVSSFHSFYAKDFEFLDKNGEKKSFKKTIDKARDFPFIVAKRTVVKYASQDPKIAIELLKRRHPDYKDKVENAVVNYAFTSIEIDDATGKEAYNQTN